MHKIQEFEKDDKPWRESHYVEKHGNKQSREAWVYGMYLKGIKWSILLHTWENHLSYAHFALEGTPPAEAIINPREVKEVQSQNQSVWGTKVPKTFPRRSRRLLREKTDIRSKVVGETQKWKEFISVGKKYWKLRKRIQYTLISKTIIDFSVGISIFC